MKTEAPNGFVERTENSGCHFGLEKAICCKRSRGGGGGWVSYTALSALKECFSTFMHVKTQFDRY